MICVPVLNGLSQIDDMRETSKLFVLLSSKVFWGQEK